MDIKKTAALSAAVIFTFFVLPLGIFTYGRYAEKLSALASASAKLVMIGASPEETKTLTPALPVGAEVSPATYWDIATAEEETETVPEDLSYEVPSPLPTEDVSALLPYPDTLESRDGVIEKYTYGFYDDPNFFTLDKGGQVRNCTNYDMGYLYDLSSRGLPFTLDKNSSEPQILIYHTHATESFEPYDRDFYDKSFACKTTERDKSIISVGDKICEQLDNAGIAYIHDTLVHDWPDYNAAYQSSRAAVSEILAAYPSIKICLDIHRDGIERDDGTRIAPVCEINGKQAAQIMIISCADDGSGNLPNYEQNFAFACELQSALSSDWPCLTRPILYDCRFYNQDLSTGSLLIEVGSHGNCLEDAQYSGELIGKTLAKLFDERQ